MSGTIYEINWNNFEVYKRSITIRELIIRDAGLAGTFFGFFISLFVSKLIKKKRKSKYNSENNKGQEKRRKKEKENYYNFETETETEKINEEVVETISIKTGNHFNDFEALFGNKISKTERFKIISLTSSGIQSLKLVV
jgi:mannitol-specific phosphotransferase system IIBC component